MATLTEQERAQEQAWKQRQAASTTLPNYVVNGRGAQSDEGTEESGQENEEPESVEDEDQAKRALYQEQLSGQKELAAEEQATEEQELTEGEGGSPEPSGDNMILFFASLFVAGLKDLLDLIGIETLGLLGTLFNFLITGVFALILLLRGSKLNNTKTIMRYVIAAIVEFIPGLNFLPAWTISVLWEKLEKKLPANLQVVSKVTGSTGKKSSNP